MTALMSSKTKQKRVDYILLKTPLEFLSFLLYPWKIQLCYTPQKFEDLKPIILELHVIFSQSPLEIPHFFN